MCFDISSVFEIPRGYVIGHPGKVSGYSDFSKLNLTVYTQESPQVQSVERSGTSGREVRAAQASPQESRAIPIVGGRKRREYSYGPLVSIRQDPSRAPSYGSCKPRQYSCSSKNKFIWMETPSCGDSL